jgi:hypothetical protein
MIALSRSSGGLSSPPRLLCGVAAVVGAGGKNITAAALLFAVILSVSVTNCGL